VIWVPDADLGILFSSVREFFDLLTFDRLECLLLAQMQKKNSSDVFWRFCFTLLVVDEMPHQRFYRRFCFPSRIRRVLRLSSSLSWGSVERKLLECNRSSSLNEFPFPLFLWRLNQIFSCGDCKPGCGYSRL
jgi:hypothetical protein